MLIPTPISGDISLYFHLPFCKKKCDYCHFYVIPDKDEFKDLLLHSLLREIEIKKKTLQELQIISLYFGGGTPSLVGAPFLRTVIQSLNQYISLEQIEITLEINPENNDYDLIKSYNDIGINRLSLGAQTFDDLLLKKLGREHSSKDILKALNNAQKAGFKNISIDLMYDLPTQSMSSWKETLLKTSTLPITHISLYNLSIEPNTVFHKHRKEIKRQMPKQEVSAEMFLMAKEHFVKNEFNHYEISAFCKDSLYSKHNVGYWLQRPHLGFGPSAFSLYDNKRFQNIPNIHKYAKSIDQLTLPIHFEEKLNQDDFLKESLALHLRLINGFNLDIFEKRFGELSEEVSTILQKLIDDGLIVKNSSILKLSEKGILYHDEIASQII